MWENIFNFKEAMIGISSAGKFDSDLDIGSTQSLTKSVWNQYNILKQYPS